jgi:hypothetical protein
VQEIACPLRESNFLIRGGIVGASEGGDPSDGEQNDKSNDAFHFHVAHKLTPYV